MKKSDYSIIRCVAAGVFMGKVASRNGDTYDLKDVRRLWEWDGAATLSQLSQEGVKKPDGCKFPMAVPFMRVMGVIEVIPMPQEAVDSIKAVPEWRID